jgi:hypothetical protein
VIILEEAAFIDQSLFHNIIVPLLGVDDTAVLAISTPDGKGNYYSELLYIKDHRGHLLFKSIVVGLACLDCQEKGRASECKHLLQELPTWKSKESQMLQKALLPDETYERESQGLILDRLTPAFKREDVKAFIEGPRYRFKSFVGVVRMAIDPNGGSSKSSQLAITSSARNTEGKVVVSVFIYT